ncbi:MAG: hypothetical protein MJ252_05400 [archaeon]|nr:hypothetical protein [archaeon]
MEPNLFKDLKQRRRKRQCSKCLLMFVFMLSLINFIQSQEEKKISSVNLLLPICKKECNKVYGSISAEGGCYTWTADRPDLIEMKEARKKSDVQGCHSKVFITPMTKSTMDYTLVTARELKSHASFGCKVGFAEPKTISIEKSFDRLNVGEDFELHVQAHDDRGNLFSSLEGWKFMWRIKEGSQYAGIQKLKEHGKTRYGKGRQFAEETAYSDIVIVTGKSVGKILIEVSILEDGLSSVIASDTKTLFIVDPFQIYPQGPLYFYVGTKFNFNIRLINSKRFINDNERKYYKWRILDDSCSTIDKMGKYKALNKICTTRVVVSDSRVELYNEDSAEVNVVIANALELLHKQINAEEKINFYKKKLERFPYNAFIQTSFWKLVEGKDYLMQNFLMYNGHPVIFNYDEFTFRLITKSISPYIEKGHETCTSSTNEICQMTTQKYYLKENLIESSIQLKEGKGFLHSSAKIIIYPKIRIEKYGMPFFTLPLFDGVKVPHQELYLNITGGSGQFRIYSEKPTVIEVIDNTYVISNHELGESKVTVIDKEIEENNDTVIIKTKEMKSLTYFEERQEIELKGEFEVTPIGLHDKNTFDIFSIFTNCSRLSFSHSLNLPQNVEELKNDNEIPINKRLKAFIKQNKETAIKNKIKFNKIKDERHEQYLDYASFGICALNEFKGLIEGLVYISYSTYHNGISASSLYPAKVYIYKPLENIPLIKDTFSNKMINEMKISHPDKERQYVIPKGISLNIKLKGGIVPWSDHKKDYSETIYAYDKYNNLMDMSYVQNYIRMDTFNSKEFVAHCLKEEYGNYFEMQIQNKADETLLKPAINKFIFNFGCYSPKHLSMYLLSQQDNKVVPMYNKPQLKGLEYYEERNFTDPLRVYAFDDSNRILCNITSLKGEWKVSQDVDNGKNVKEYYDIIPEKYYKSFKVKDVSFSNEFIQDVFLFRNYLSTFHIMHVLKKNLLKHYLTISVVDLPKLIPDSANIYIRNKIPFEIKIEGGSGVFNVTSPDEQYAKVSYSKGSRKIFIQPYARGIVEVDLIDNFIPTRIVKGIYNLVDLKELKIQHRDMVMVNKTNDIPITAIDTFGKEMTKEQMKQIPLVVEANKGSQGMFMKLSDNNTLVFITGLIAGEYQINVMDTNSEIKSNECSIEVFDGLEIFPPKLLLFPGSSYTLFVKGGPSRKDLVKMRYVIENTKVAEVFSPDYPLVKAKEIGETKLKITLSYKYSEPKFFKTKEDTNLIEKEGTLLCMEEVPVTVAFPERVGIRYGEGTRKVYTESVIRLFSVLKKDDQDFTYGTGPIQFFWSVDNQRVAKMLYYMKSKDYSMHSDTTFCDSSDKDKCNNLVTTDEDKDPAGTIGVFLETLSEGELNIFLNVKINYPYPYSARKDILKTQEKIGIRDEIFINLPMFYNSEPKRSGIYLIPLDIDHNLSTNKKIDSTYKILQQYDKDAPNNKEPKIISLSKTGRVTTYLKKGLANVLILPKENTDNANNKVPLPLSIYVSEFHSIFIERTDQLVEVEIGQELLLKVIIQHETGILFAEKFDRMKLRVIQSHPRVATGELIDSNSKLRIRTYALGSTNIILFHPQTLVIYDVFRITVNKNANAIQKIILNLGGTVNFLEKDLEVKSKMTTDAFWESENKEIVKINRYGKAVAVAEGTTLINLKTRDKNRIIFSAKVEVKKVVSISLDKSAAPTGLTDIKNSANYKSVWKIPVELFTDTGEEFAKNSNDTMNIINQNILVKCISQNPEIVVAKAKEEDGDYYCNLETREVKFKKGINKPKEIIIKVTMDNLSSDRKKKYSKEYVQKFPFASSFNIKYDIKSLNFTHSSRNRILNLDNLNDLKISVSDESLIQIDKNYEDNSIKVTIPYKVVEPFSNEKIVITNILSGQREDILINFGRPKNSGYLFSLIPWSFFFSKFMICIYTVLVIIFACGIKGMNPLKKLSNLFNQNQNGFYPPNNPPPPAYPGSYPGGMNRSYMGNNQGGFGNYQPSFSGQVPPNPAYGSQMAASGQYYGNPPMNNNLY